LRPDPDPVYRVRGLTSAADKYTVKGILGFAF
jgi:hypothetical protein